MNWAFNDVKKNVSAKYNNGLSMILPYTYFVPQGSPYPLFSDTAVLGSDGKTALTAMIGSVTGQCMNPFNYNFAVYLQMQFDANLNKGFDSIWLDSNFPYFTGSDQQSNKQTNPFYEIPFVPGGLALANGTLPEFSKYKFSNGAVEYHYNLLGSYGDKFA